MIRPALPTLAEVPLADLSLAIMATVGDTFTTKFKDRSMCWFSELPFMNVRPGRIVDSFIAVSVSAVFLTCLGSAADAQTAGRRAATLRQSAEESRAATRDLEARRPAVIAGSLVMNTVRQFPKKKELDGYLGQRVAEARVWDEKLAAGNAQRTVVVNPYKGSTYTKYYDGKGDWQFSVIENDYRATEKLQEDWSREFRRARANLEALQRDYAGLVADGGLQAAQQSEIAAMLASAGERMGQFGTPPPELLPHPVEGDANSPYPSFRAYDAVTGKLIAIGSSGGGGRPLAAGDATNDRPGGEVDPGLRAKLQAQLIMGPPNLGWGTISRTPPGFGSLYFDADDVGSVTGWLREGGQRKGRWRATGPATIELDFPGIGTIRGTLNGDQMTLGGCTAYPEQRVLKRHDGKKRGT